MVLKYFGSDRSIDQGRKLRTLSIMRNSGFMKGSKEEHRLQAVLCLLGGRTAVEVSNTFNIARSDLFKLKHRAIVAMKSAMTDKPRGPKKPFNRVSQNEEQKVRAVCERFTNLSSYEICKKLGSAAPSARTVQRIRKRLSLPRVSRRSPEQRKRRKFSRKEKKIIREMVRAKLFLGPLRLRWELINQLGLYVSPSTLRRVKIRLLAGRRRLRQKPLVSWLRYERRHPHSLWHGDLMEKVTLTDEDITAYQLTLLDDYSRGYVFCDLFRTITGNTVLAAIISAMRNYQVIPKAILFDNGQCFRALLISLFCDRLGIRLIHSSPYHPQTNGKLERAFRDDMKDFYRRREQWIFDELRSALPEYVTYRNTIRGHLALGGRPSATRLAEQDAFALPFLLDTLESYAWSALGKKVVKGDGTVMLYAYPVHLDPAFANATITLYESMLGLEAQAPDGRFYLLPTAQLQPLRSMVSCPWERRNNHYFEFIPCKGSERRDQQGRLLNNSP